MSIHKSQGSEFDEVAVLLPDESSPLLTRELLYTAVTRARRKVFLYASRESVRRAVERPVARASGLAVRLARAGVEEG
jgi:exodeoxyribonuclease V alpha subunit